MNINDTSEVKEKIEEKYKGYKVKFFESRLGGIYAYAIDNRSETGLNRVIRKIRITELIIRVLQIKPI